MNTISYTEFCTYPLSEKVDFFDNGITPIVQSVEENQLYKFLKQIILNVTENAFIRKTAITTLVESVFLGKIKNRQAISILVDEWEYSPHIFVELQRIKDLFYFCDIDPDIQNIYKSYLTNEESEIVAEAQFNLGFIHLQKGFEAASKDDKINCFQTASQYFKDSDNSIENRIDAKFYRIISSILLDLLNLKIANIDNQLKQLSEVLKEKWLNSFDFKENVMDVSFYRTLTSIANLIKENPENWTDYLLEFNKLYECYADIKNQEIKNRLNKSNLSNAFLVLCDEEFIEPYFALNFHSQVVKIDNCIQKCLAGSTLYDFLLHIKKLAEDIDFKKKVDTETIEQKLKNSFPERNSSTIEKVVKKIIDPTSPIEWINAFDILNSNSIEKFIDTLILACVNLQGNRIYKFSNKEIEENDRNTYIADILSAAGYKKEPQTLWGESPGGKNSGEIDIMFKDSRGLPLTIIEALNWRDWDYLKTHIDKLFNNYDTAGFENNFIVVYANAKKFGEHCKKYIEYIRTKHNYKYTFQSVKEIDDYRYTDLKIYKAEHIRQENKVFLYHVIINFSG
jgi:hypothetical protein